MNNPGQTNIQKRVLFERQVKMLTTYDFKKYMGKHGRFEGGIFILNAEQRNAFSEEISLLEKQGHFNSRYIATRKREYVQK